MTQREFPFDINLINRLINLYDTPLQIYDEYNIKQNAIYFMNTFKKHVNGFRQFFAVKALPNPHILKILVDLGMGLDCSSIAELKLAELINVPSHEIMFTSNFTSDIDLKYALKQNVIINLDDYGLIESLYNIENRLPTKLFFRFNPGIGKTNSETSSNILGGADAKFGMDRMSIINACTKAISLGTTELGIHMMTGSNILDLNYWDELLEKLFELLNILSKYCVTIQHVNLGGGIGIDYKNGIPVDIELLAKKISFNVIKYSKQYNLQIPNIYMENGRFITGPYGYLIARCNCVKTLYGNTFYGLDACMSNLMRTGMYNSYHHISILGKTICEKKANVVGTLCENNDWFAKDRLLPIVNKNNYFVIWDTGAHAHSMGFQYNGKLRAPEVLINKLNFKLIRRRETFENYIDTVVKI